ncbi:MAG: LamG-like jellyroll fold domain-containing protein, partial [Planctomycetota bacterium]
MSVTTAVADGDWLDPSTWDSGVPDADTRAIISQGVTVSLTGTSHVAKEVVVHGVLFADEELSPAVVGPDRVGVYFNGELTGTQQASQVWVHSDPIGIGSVAGGATRIDGGVLDSSNSGLRGSIDSIAVYNRALTEAEIAQIASGERNSGAAIDTQDAAAEWLFDAGPPLAGDYNGDNAVNAADYTVWLDAFGTNVASPGDGADGNGDGVVNAADYTVWRDGLGGVLDTAAATADNAPNDAIDDDGTLTGAGAALVDGALQLDGSSGIEVAPSAELTDGVFLEKTISLWFRTDSAGAFQVIYEQGDQERGLNLYLSRGSLYAGGWNTPEEESGWQGDWVVKSGITAGEWHHVALTLDAGYGAATGDVPVTSPANKSLTADWVHVNSGGVFQIGSQTDRYDTGTFSLTLTGDDPDADPVVETATGTMSIANNGAFLMTAGGGRLQFHGDEKLPFTKLAATADVGAGSLIVENVIERNFDGVTSAASDGSLDWAVGDQVVVASSSYSYQDEEVRTITSVVDLGNGTTELGLDQPLAERHFGGVETYSNSQRSWDIDLRAEVALLNRSIVVQGDEGSDTD